MTMLKRVMAYPKYLQWLLVLKCFGVLIYFPMCIPFVIAQNHENFSSFQHGLGLQLNDHVENGDGLFRASLGALDTKMFWGVDSCTMVGTYLF
jgi:hypothetical protein